MNESSNIIYRFKRHVRINLFLQLFFKFTNLLVNSQAPIGSVLYPRVFPDWLSISRFDFAFAAESNHAIIGHPVQEADAVAGLDTKHALYSSIPSITRYLHYIRVLPVQPGFLKLVCGDRALENTVSPSLESVLVEHVVK